MIKTSCNEQCNDSCIIPKMAEQIANKNSLSDISDSNLEEIWNKIAYCNFIHWSYEQKTSKAMRTIFNEQSSREERLHGYVYLMQCGPYYKIGLSKNPTSRLKQLSTIPPFDIEIIHLIDTYRMRLVEKTLHGEFHSKRKNGEWFELSQEDVEFIKSIDDDCAFDYLYSREGEEN